MKPNVQRRVLAEGKHLRLVESSNWEYLERSNATWAAVIVPITTAGKLVFVEQFRIPVNSRCIEFPAGLAGDRSASRDEPVLEAAKRELLEETGYVADHWEQLAGGAVSPGLSNEMIEMYLATGLRRVGAGGGDGNENIVIHEIHPANVEAWLEEMVREGCTIDPKIFAGLYFVATRR